MKKSLSKLALEYAGRKVTARTRRNGPYTLDEDVSYEDGCYHGYQAGWKAAMREARRKK